MVRAAVAVALPALALAPVSAAAWPGRPAAPPPSAGPSGPPPAWIESRAKSHWLAYGTYCWKMLCVDDVPPQNRHDLPTFTVKRGATVRVHLRFAAKSVSVSVGSQTVRKRVDPTRRIVTWTARRGGVLSVFAVPRTRGDATYHARLRVR